MLTVMHSGTGAASGTGTTCRVAKEHMPRSPARLLRRLLQPSAALQECKRRAACTEFNGSCVCWSGGSRHGQGCSWMPSSHPRAQAKVSRTVAASMEIALQNLTSSAASLLDCSLACALDATCLHGASPRIEGATPKAMHMR